MQSSLLNSHSKIAICCTREKKNHAELAALKVKVNRFSLDHLWRARAKRGEAIEIEFARFSELSQSALRAGSSAKFGNVEFTLAIIVKIVSKINLMYVIWN